MDKDEEVTLKYLAVLVHLVFQAVQAVAQDNLPVIHQRKGWASLAKEPEELPQAVAQ